MSLVMCVLVMTLKASGGDPGAASHVVSPFCFSNHSSQRIARWSQHRSTTSKTIAMNEVASASIGCVPHRAKYGHAVGSHSSHAIASHGRVAGRIEGTTRRAVWFHIGRCAYSRSAAWVQRWLSSRKRLERLFTVRTRAALAAYSSAMSRCSNVINHLQIPLC